MLVLLLFVGVAFVHIVYSVIIDVVVPAVVVFNSYMLVYPLVVCTPVVLMMTALVLQYLS